MTNKGQQNKILFFEQRQTLSRVARAHSILSQQFHVNNLVYMKRDLCTRKEGNKRDP